MTDERQRWKQERKKGIGGSDAAAIMGANPYKAPEEVWQEKTDPFYQEPEPTPAMKRGSALEPVIKEMYLKESGRVEMPAVEYATGAKMVTMDPALFRSNEPSWLQGSPDSIIQGNGEGLGVLEIKAPGLQMFHKTMREGLPAMYSVQLQHYLNLLKLKWGAFAVFSAELWKLIFFDVEADPELQKMILEAGARFWEYVEAKEPPPPLEPKDVIDLPPVKGDLVTMDSAEWGQAVKELQEAKEIKTGAEALEEEAKERLQGLMGDAQIAEGGGVRVYWTPQERKSFDSKAFKKDHPDLYERYVRPKQTRPFRPFFLKPTE